MMKGRLRGSANINDQYEWHDWYAWRPVMVWRNSEFEVDRRWMWVWREWVYRKRAVYIDGSSNIYCLEVVDNKEQKKTQRQAAIDAGDARYLSELHKLKDEMDGKSNEPV